MEDVILILLNRASEQNDDVARILIAVHHQRTFIAPLAQDVVGSGLENQ